jgi:hypothetical protein
MLPDGWEARHGLDPCVPDTAASLTWDGDGDGLGLFDEFRCGTDPGGPDTDGDGVTDGDEMTPRAAGGPGLLGAGGPGGPLSCPTDASDGGDAANCVTLKLTVGDPSDSNSERWNMEVSDDATGALVIRHCDDGFGTPGSAEYALVKGKTYRFSLRWIGTDPDYEYYPQPDYDWQCLVNDSYFTGPLEALYGTGIVIVEDDDGLLTWERHGNDTDITIGLEGRIHVPKIVTETVAEQPPDRSRKTVGVGEEVKLTLLPVGLGTVTWSISEGSGQLSHYVSDAPITFTAPDEADNVTLAAAVGGVECEVALVIIEPSGVLMENKAAVASHCASTWMSISYQANVYFQPDTVNFYRISYFESASAMYATGCYTIGHNDLD